jgi:hypothetical protein
VLPRFPKGTVDKEYIMFMAKPRETFTKRPIKLQVNNIKMANKEICKKLTRAGSFPKIGFSKRDVEAYVSAISV